MVNICCTHLISEITNTSLVDSATASVDSNPRRDPEKQTFDDACKRDLGRDVVRALRASGQRREHLDTIIDNGNKDGFFFIGESTTPVQVQHLQLLRDVKTRWDSVYYMIRRLRLLRPVCDTNGFFQSTLIYSRLLTTSLFTLSTKILPNTPSAKWNGMYLKILKPCSA